MKTPLNILFRLLWKNILDEGCQINKLIFEQLNSGATDCKEEGVRDTPLAVCCNE